MSQNVTPLKINLLTACSSTRVIPPIVKVEDMPENITMGEGVKWWVNKLNSVPTEDLITPREQYRGTGFITLAKILAFSGVEVQSRIVTGGQGLIALDDPIAPYDFTASPKEEHNVQQKITAEPFVQTVWWGMINDERFGMNYPCANLINQDPDRLTLVAMPKIFLRYISEDLLSAKSLDNVRIVLASSSLGSVPQQLRPWIIPYNREAIAHIPGNRNDNAHRAAMAFLQECLRDESFLEKSAGEQSQLFLGASRTNSTRLANPEQVKQALLERPHLMQLSADEAYTVLRRELGTLGGRMTFRGIFRAMSGNRLQQPASGEAARKAVDALKGLNLQQNQSTGDEEATIEACNIFCNALEDYAPLASFSASDVCKWAASYYEGNLEERPESLTSPNKLTHILKANTEILRIKTSDGKAFSLDRDKKGK